MSIEAVYLNPLHPRGMPYGIHTVDSGVLCQISRNLGYYKRRVEMDRIGCGILSYSVRNASIGEMCEALKAG